MYTAPLLAIRCITYNHEPYIRQCLEGFVIQKTNFPFIAIVHDDASTDNTASIIREFEEKYPDIIKPIYETENQYSKGDGSLTRIMNGAIPEGTKYIAFCEGDDYWIDENKLQMQVDFLEANPEYGMCYTAARQWNQAKGKFDKKIFNKNIDELYVEDFYDLLFNGNRIPTLTTVMRADIEKRYIKDVKPETKNWAMGDYPRWLYIIFYYKIKFIPKITGIYRFLTESASHSNDIDKKLNFSMSSQYIKNYFIRNFTNYEESIVDEHKKKAWLLHNEKIKDRRLINSEISKAHSLYKLDRILRFTTSNNFIFLFKDFIFFFCNIFIFIRDFKKNIMGTKHKHIHRTHIGGGYNRLVSYKTNIYAPLFGQRRAA